MNLVLDSSVVIKWFKTKEEKNVLRARSYLRSLKDNKLTISVPDLIYYEIANIARGDRFYQNDFWEESLVSLFSLDWDLHVPDKEFCLDTLSLAKEISVSAYDATYLVLAKRLNTVLVTEDKELLTKAPNLTKPL